MLAKQIVIFTVQLCCVSALYSSFWAPLYDRKILNYRVDVPFVPEAGRSAREQYEKEYGYRGERLIADLGNGRGPEDKTKIVGDKVSGDVTFYYT